MKDKNKIRLPKITWNILNGFRIMFIAFILISILIAIYYLITAPPTGLPCLMCVGCPCPYRDFIIARNYYLSFLFPMLILLNAIFITIFSILIVILKYRDRVLKLALFKKSYGDSEDLFKRYKNSLQSNEIDLKSKLRQFKNKYS